MIRISFNPSWIRELLDRCKITHFTAILLPIGESHLAPTRRPYESTKASLRYCYNRSVALHGRFSIALFQG